MMHRYIYETLNIDIYAPIDTYIRYKYIDTYAPIDIHIIYIKIYASIHPYEMIHM